jgi:hypothetical protein
MKRSFLTEASTDFENDFELEFNDSSSNELEERDNEFELADQELGDVQNEYENIEGEFESDDRELEDNNYEYANTDSESSDWLNNEYDGSEREYEDRIYAALSGEYESSYEMEQEIDKVLYEMEMDYFFNPFKKLKGLKNLAKKIAGNLQSLAKLAGIDVRSLLKNDWVKKGLSLAANAVAPGVGGAIASGLLNSGLLNNEMPSANNLRQQAKQAVQVAKSAYQNMAGLMPTLRSGNIPDQLKRFSRMAFDNAKRKHSIYRGKRKQVIATAPGSIVVVRPDKVVIYS